MDVKKIVIAFSVLLMISGATISVLKWLKIGPFSEAVVEEAVVEEKPEELPLEVDIDDLIIPLFDDDRVAATVMINLKLEVKGTENEEKVTKLLPRLSDAFLRDLYAFIPRVVRKEGKLTPSILRERMKMIGEKVLGPEVIHDIIIEEMTER